MGKITKIVLTGGPCAGKTTGMSWIQNAFEARGYTVLVVPETATELILGGLNGSSCGSLIEFQTYMLHLQMLKESIFVSAAKNMNKDKILIVCDRGVMDMRAFMSDEEYAQMLRNEKLNEVELRDNYDGIFHLVTAAKGAEEFYTTANNAARTETVEQAAAVDTRIISAWTGHPHLRVIENDREFEGKMKHLIAEISHLLGEPETYEIERKYLIEYPDLEKLEKLPNCEKVGIIQTYLNAPEGEEVRIRQRGSDGHFLYYETRKRRTNGLGRVEIERRLTAEEYVTLLMNADLSRRPIRKDRYCLTENGHYFEIDVYPFWKKQAVMELELKTEDEEIVFPKEVKVLREVTEDERYKNAALAMNIPEEG